MTSKKKRILIVDDEKDICEILSYNLANEGYDCTVAHSGEEVLELSNKQYDLFLLDIMMKKVSGYKLAEKLRKDHSVSSPIIFLTAKNTEADKLHGFEIGADDFITKPFSVKEVVARVKAVLARTNPIKKKDSKTVITDGFVIDFEKKRVIIQGEKKNLTPKEFEVLCLLVDYPGKIFSRHDILLRVWETEYVVERTIDVTITRLRKKIGPFRDLIESRSGFGYSYEPES